MIGILQWTTLAVCGAVTLARIPCAIRGENRSLFAIFALAAVAILLSIDGPYTVVDRALGGLNIANLALRFVVFAAIFFLGLQVARGFGADDALRLITGPIGIGVAAAASAVVVALFLLMDTSGSSVGLSAVYANHRNAAMVGYYAAAGRLYPAFVTAALLPAMLRTLRSTLPALLRCSAALMALGTAAVALSLLTPVIPLHLGFLAYVTNYAAVLFLILGLTLIWLAKVLARRAQKQQAVLTR